MKTLLLAVVLAGCALAQEKGAPLGPAPLAPGEVIRVVDVKQGNTQEIQNNIGKIFPGISRVNNQLIVRGQPAVVEMIEAAITKLDVPSGEVTRIVPVRYGDINNINRAVFRDGVNLTFAGDQFVIRGPADEVTRVETAIKALDVPPLNVELTVQLLMGSSKEGSSSPMPEDLQPTLKQLQTVFPYKSYRLLDTQVIRARGEGNQRGVETSGQLPGLEPLPDMPITFQFKAQPSVSNGDAPRIVHLAGLNLGFRVPTVSGTFKTGGEPGVNTTFQYNSVGILADLDVKEGQKTVVGKTNLSGFDDAIILVITPKVVQ